MVIRLYTKYKMKILKVSRPTRIRQLKTAGLCGITLFLDVGYLIHGHQTVFEKLY